MLSTIYIAMGIALYFDMPVMPIIIIGALMQAGMAYMLTMSEVCIRSAVSVVACVIGTYVILPMLSEGAQDTAVEAFMPWSEGMTVLASVTTLIVSTVIGILDISDKITSKQKKEIDMGDIKYKK